MDEAAIDEFVDQLIDGGQFRCAATAVAERAPALLRSSTAGRFDTWLMIALAAIAEQCLQRDDRIGIGVLQGTAVCQSFDQSVEEGGGAFLRRLRAAALRQDEPWLLVGLRDGSGTLWWYAEARGRGTAQSRVGRLGGDGDQHAFTGEPIHPSDAHSLGRILYRHPARRRFPLRQA